MDELAMATDKAKLVVHRFQHLEISCSNGLGHLTMRIDEARDNLHFQSELLRDYGHTIKRARARTRGLQAQVHALVMANEDLAERLEHSVTMNDNLADRLRDSEASIDALERKMDDVLSALQQLSVAPNARV
jgi:chromosome segregation ATPase